jgi:hypothetical protein
LRQVKEDHRGPDQDRIGEPGKHEEDRFHPANVGTDA